MTPGMTGMSCEQVKMLILVIILVDGDGVEELHQCSNDDTSLRNMRWCQVLVRSITSADVSSVLRTA